MKALQSGEEEYKYIIRSNTLKTWVSRADLLMEVAFTNLNIRPNDLIILPGLKECENGYIEPDQRYI